MAPSEPIATRRVDAARFGGGLAIAAAIVAARWLLDPIAADRLHYVAVPWATVLALWFYGPGPAVAAFAVSFAASQALFGLSTGDYTNGATGQAVHMAALVGETIGFSWLVWSQQRAQASMAAQVREGSKQRQRLATEIAERREVAASLQASREEFEVLATKAPVGILRADATGRCTFVNEQWCRMTGYTTAETLGYEWSRCVHPDDLLGTMAEWEASTREQRPYRHDLRLVRKDGEVRYVSALALPIRDAGGTITGFIGTVVDTTEQRRAEEQGRSTELRLRSIVDNASAVIFLKDAAGRYLLANRRLYDDFGLRSEDIIGKTDADCFSEDIARRLVEADAEVWKTAKAVSVEEYVPQTDGRHTYLTVKFPICDSAGRMTALGGVSTDITDLKKVQQELEHKQHLLRNLIDIQEREKQLLCNEFHDGLIQYAVGAKMMLEGCRDQHAASLPPTITKTIDAVIEFLRKGIEDGRRAILGIRPAVLDDLGLAAALAEIAEQGPAAGIEVTTTIDPDVGPLPEDLQTTVYRVVQESLHNAHKHSGARHARVELRREGRSLRLTVEDDGCGFDPDGTRNGGFGLLGMNERVRLAGGTFSVESGRDVGTRIAVELPLPQPE